MISLRLLLVLRFRKIFTSPHSFAGNGKDRLRESGRENRRHHYTEDFSSFLSSSSFTQKDFLEMMHTWCLFAHIRQTRVGKSVYFFFGEIICSSVRNICCLQSSSSSFLSGHIPFTNHWNVQMHSAKSRDASVAVVLTHHYRYQLCEYAIRIYRHSMVYNELWLFHMRK